jgi:hypothetical protein
MHQEDQAMKKLFESLPSVSWLNGLMSGRTFSPVRKTPWYRRRDIVTARWIPGVLVVPLGMFLGWKGFAKIRSRAKHT